jgi:Bifunctional DNA primase/polymerase, N-terminal
VSAGREDANGRAAQAYAAHGWPVFPCVPGEKVPVTSHGLLDASTDPGSIGDWWGRNPDRNVAIATGAPGPDVLDVDRYKDGSGFPAFNQLKREGLVPDPLALVRTPSGGFHAYFAGTEQRNGHLPKHHIDYRAQGGYVVAPPSAVGGRPYEVVKHQPSAATFDWDAAKHLLDPQPERRREPQRDGDRPRDVSHLVAWVASQEKGNRNLALFWAGNRALEAGQPELLDDLGAAAIRAGHPEREAWRTVQSLRQRMAAAPGSGPDPTLARRAEREREAG